MTTDQGTDLGEYSSDIDTADESSPVRRVHKQFRSSGKTKPQHKKRMPPELKVTPAKVRKKKKSAFTKMLSPSKFNELKINFSNFRRWNHRSPLTKRSVQLAR